MNPANHSHDLERVMAYVDGALDASTAESVRQHIAGCSECRQAELDLRAVSQRLHSWDVGAAPAMRAPAIQPVTKPSPNAWFSWLLSVRGLTLATASIGVVLIGGVVMQPRKSPPVTAAEEWQSSAVAPPGARGNESGRTLIASKDATAVAAATSSRPAVAGTQEHARGPMIVRTARLTIVASDYDVARRELERVVKDAGGFVGSIVAQGAGGSARRLEATLRVPTAKLDDTIGALRRLGQVTAEAQDGEDVTQQSADLDTRLENARVSEKRLRNILAQRTGKLSDVLDVEREIGRVRGEIEQMEAERRLLDRRVSYATLTVSLSEDRKSEVNLGPVPVSRRLRNAFVEGWSDAIAGAVGAMLVMVRVAPTLLVWTVILGPAIVFARRRWFTPGL